ncbi:fused MFS/spermidine synthase [Paludibaculum fermentans]|uniref:Fused MFS/spermidine synthase n=1 Tax=Paludibaculum fermentans TaxID=1473598 RepID=A0A7S7NJQ3_PALFE|nr:fused MFS/spermidine synthase [Paludibaculum fermentans]QOY84901.1 fused MFS/spermidine synthase [Paludibaculum fermentans]
MQSTEVQASPARAWWPLALYALTGFTGVLAEQGFEKYVALLVGATVFSSAIVIFAYFLGFALGAGGVARLQQKWNIRHPLRIYGALELAIGLSAVAFSYGFHPLVDLLGPLQSTAQGTLMRMVVRFTFGASLVLPTAVLMGASFPLIAMAVDPRNENSGRRWVRAYASNLIGAVTAALSGAFLVMPVLGVRGCMWLCAGLGAVVCALTFLLPQEDTSAARAQAARFEGRQPVQHGWLLLTAAFVSGLVFFALEVIWTHLIGNLLGSSIYAFSSMLGLVLIGLLIGSLRAGRLRDAGRPIVFSRLFQVSAVLLLVQFRLWDYSQLAFGVQLPDGFRNFYTVELYKLLIAAILIVPPSALLGTLFPALLRHPSLARQGGTYFVGYLNAANSIGCISGALASVFFFIPVLGSAWSLKTIALLLALSGLGLLWYEKPGRRALMRSTAILLLLGGYASTWSWDRRLLTSGMNVYFGNTPKEPEGPRPKVDARMIFFEEDAQGGLTTVIESKGVDFSRRVLFTNGKYEGSDDLRKQGSAQLGFAVIPSQFVGNFNRALLIGLGTGHSAHGLVRLGYADVDIAEYSPGIVHAAASWFGGRNGYVLNEPHVHLHVEDGRNVLLTARPSSYDLITLEVTSVWFAGATNLYSAEFYDLAKSRLNPEGVLQQWIQVHHISPREIASILGTLRARFRHVSFWLADGQGVVVASNRPHDLTPERRAYLDARLRTFSEVPENFLAELEKNMYDSRVLDTSGVDRLLSSAKPVINTDHNRWLEYATPRYNWTDDNWPSINLAWLRSFAASNAAALRPSRDR